MVADSVVEPRRGTLVMGRQLFVVIEQEEDGRWIAEIEPLPGVLAYGATPDDARAKAEALALRVLADRREHGEPVPEIEGLFEAA
jgi:predicted RNase H-like HicB family nuclease